MEKFLSELDKLKKLIEHEKEKYTQAILNNKDLEETKSIYLTIKLLEKEVEQLTANN